MWTDLLIALASLAGGVLLLWLVLVAVLAVTRPRGNLLTETVRILPDLLRLVTRLARDRSLPRGVRVRLWLLLAYLASPIDLIPDFIPVLGYADDAIIVAVVLRSVIRRAGTDAITRHWPGTRDGLAALGRLTGAATADRPAAGHLGISGYPRVLARKVLSCATARVCRASHASNCSCSTKPSLVMRAMERALPDWVSTSAGSSSSCCCAVDSSSARLASSA